MQASIADVDIAVEEIKGVKAVAKSQLQTVQNVQGTFLTFVAMHAAWHFREPTRPWKKIGSNGLSYSLHLIMVSSGTSDKSLRPFAGTRNILEDQLAASQIFSAAFAEAAAKKEEAIKAHIGTVHIEEVRTLLQLPVLTTCPFHASPRHTYTCLAPTLGSL